MKLIALSIFASCAFSITAFAQGSCWGCSTPVGSIPVPNIGSIPVPNIGSIPVPNTGSIPVPNMGSIPYPNVGSIPVPNIGSIPVPNIGSIPVPNIGSIPVPNIGSIPVPNIGSIPVPQPIDPSHGTYNPYPTYPGYPYPSPYDPYYPYPNGNGGYGQPGYGNGGYAQPTYPQPTYPQPGYGYPQPMYPQPTYPQPPRRPAPVCNTRSVCDSPCEWRENEGQYGSICTVLNCRNEVQRYFVQQCDGSSSPSSPSTAPADTFAYYTVVANTFFKADNLDSARVAANRKCALQPGTQIEAKVLAYKSDKIVKVILTESIVGCVGFGTRGHIGFIFLPHVNAY